MSKPLFGKLSHPISQRIAILGLAGLLGVAAYRQLKKRDGRHHVDIPFDEATAKVMPPVPASAPNVDAVVLVGPSGVGKGTLITRLMQSYASRFAFSVSHTSRQPREGEVDGVNYHFSDKATMRTMQERGEFLEMCAVHDNLYGTSFLALDAVRKSGKTPLIEVDYKGAQKIKNAVEKTKEVADLTGSMNRQQKFLFLFISPPSLQTLEDRIVKRGSDSFDKVQLRLETARSEMDFLENHRDFFDDVLVNDNLDTTFETLLDILRERKCI